MTFLGNGLNGTRNKWLDLKTAFFKGSYSQKILGWILMIVHKLSSLGGALINIFFTQLQKRLKEV